MCIRDSIDTVTRHSRYFTGAFQTLDDTQFIRRGYTGEDGCCFYRIVQFVIRHRIQFLTGYDGVAFSVNIQLFRNGKGCHLMVAGDHNRSDARLTAGTHLSLIHI